MQSAGADFALTGESNTTTAEPIKPVASVTKIRILSPSGPYDRSTILTSRHELATNGGSLRIVPDYRRHPPVARISRWLKLLNLQTESRARTRSGTANASWKWRSRG